MSLPLSIRQNVIEYKWSDRYLLLSPRLNGSIRYGTYGTIVLEVFYVREFYGKMYQPVDNAEEAEWWLTHYNAYYTNRDIHTLYFLPAPDQHESRQPFVAPELPPPPDDNEGYNTPWNDQDNTQYTVGKYTKTPNHG